MKIVAVAEYEGGQWINTSTYHQVIRARHGRDARVHAIMFEDGSVWDAYNGMREQSTEVGAEERRRSLIEMINAIPDDELEPASADNQRIEGDER